MKRRSFIQTSAVLSAGSLAGLGGFSTSSPNLQIKKTDIDRKSLINHQRQIHLDFHTSPFITDVSKDFDATVFAKRLKEAHINSITVFAKCHHGMAYYPTKVGIQHPALKGKNLLGEMLEALHREGIRAPIYTTVGWEEIVASTHPEWRQLKKNGDFAACSPFADPGAQQQAPWKFNDWLHPDYQDYFEAHLNEILTGYEVDGIFIDIVFYDPQGSWSEESVKFRKKHGLLADTLENHFAHEALAQGEFAKRFTQFIHNKVPNASVFYNAPNNMYIDGEKGALAKAQFQTHFEIESLPSGFWGYYHFPRLARRLAHKGKPWLGMTGKFQKMWGDFGGIKPQAALEFECFRSQALGGGNSIGDQLHPRGVLDEETYQLIGSVYSQTELAEPFYENSRAIPQIGVMSPNHPSLDDKETNKSEEGVVLLLEELHYDCAILDDSSDLAGFELIILPDTVIISDKLKEKLNAYQKSGGKILISYKSGLDKNNKWSLSQFPIEYQGDVDAWPTFWKPTSQMTSIALKSERVFYQQGLNMKPGSELTILVDRVVPYFRRSDLKFCSHFQTPPDKIDKLYPAVMGNKQMTYFADPVFNEYRQSGNRMVKKVLQDIIEQMAGKPLAGYKLSPSVLSVPRRRSNDLIITLLNYIPVRKSLDIDIIDQPQSFAGEVLYLPQKAQKVFCVTTGKNLVINKDGGFDLPNVKGRLLLEVKNFFI